MKKILFTAIAKKSTEYKVFCYDLVEKDRFCIGTFGSKAEAEDLFWMHYNFDGQIFDYYIVGPEKTYRPDVKFDAYFG